jgi:arabinofuranosyltransferase
MNLERKKYSDILKTKLLVYFFILFFISIMTFIAWYCNGQSILGIDDANIYKVYMRNFANGDGFVYNINGERVEGFTSLLWTLIGAFFIFFGFPLEISLLILSIFLVSFLLYEIVKFIQINFDLNIFQKISILFFFPYIIIVPGYFEWNILSLMENGIWSFLHVLTLLQIIKWDLINSKRKVKIKILFVLLILCRPESYYFVLVYIFLLFFKQYKKSNSYKISLNENKNFFFVYFITITLLTLFRLIYFNSLLPNTFYAKVSLNLSENCISSLEYLIQSFKTNTFLILVFLITVLFFLFTINKSKNKKQEVNIYLVGVFVLSTIIPIFLSGGDHFQLGRFFQSFMPIYSFFVIITINFYFKKPIVLLTFILLFSVFSSPFTLLHALKYKSTNLIGEWEITMKSREVAFFFNDFFSVMDNYPTQGVITAGASAFYYKGKTIDLMGLNNTIMAHAKKIKNKNAPKNHGSFSKKVFYELKPDLFLFKCDLISKHKFNRNDIINFSFFFQKSFLYIHKDSFFKEKYSLVFLENKKFRNGILVFANNAYLKKLNANKITYTKIHYI